MTVLVIDGDEQSLDRLEQALAEAIPWPCLQVVRFADPMLAVKYLAGQNAAPYFVFTALLLPRMDGFELMRCCRKLHPGVPTFAVGETDSREMRRLAWMNGAVEYLVKPVIGAAVRQAIRNL